MTTRSVLLLIFGLVSFSAIAQKQDIVLFYEEGFSGGTTDRWQYNNQFAYEHNGGSTYGLIKAPYKTATDFEFPLPGFNTANNRLGKDFTLSLKVGNGQPRAVTDTGIFIGVNIELAKGYSIGLSVNGINKFQAIALGEKYRPIFLTGKYPGHKPWLDYAFSDLKIQKKSDSLIFSINDKTILRTLIVLLDSSDTKLISPSELSYLSAAFYASNNKQAFSSTHSFVVDDFTVLWLARKGDELLAEELLNKSLQKFTFYSNPYFGKYIIAKTRDDDQCVLNMYGNYVIPPTSDPIRVTNQPGIFVREDGAREDFYDDKGQYTEFGAAKTKALLASQKEPVYLQSQPLMTPLPLRHYNKSLATKDDAAWALPFFRTIGITTEGTKKGLRSSSGKIYYHPGFEEIWVEQVTGADNMYSGSVSDYRIMAKFNGNTIGLGLEETNPDKLFRQSSTTDCKICHGKGGKTTTGYREGDYVPAKYKTDERSYVYTSVYGDKWKKTYTYTSKVAEGYYKKGDPYTIRESCKTCNGKGYSEKRSTYLVWNAVKKQYEEKIETERVSGK